MPRRTAYITTPDAAADVSGPVTSASSSSSSSPPSTASPRRPGLQQFDSLQHLLEKAGYKETRVFTPYNAKAPTSPPAVTAASTSATRSSSTASSSSKKASVDANGDSVASSMSDSLSSQTPQSLDEQHVDAIRSTAASSSWFQSIPKRQSASQQGHTKQIQKKQSEPVLSRKKSWITSWWGQPASDDEEHPQTHRQASPAAPQTTASSERRKLRHAPSTQSLWHASLRHHRAVAETNVAQPAETHTALMARSRSFPSKAAAGIATRAPISRKQSYDGARVVAGVGMRSTGPLICHPNDVLRSHKRRISLREAFETPDKDASEIDRSSDETVVDDQDERRAEWSDSLSKLKTITAARELSINSDDASQEHGSDTLTEAVAQPTIAGEAQAVRPRAIKKLFSNAAGPLLSRDDAVAMRNSACLDFGSASASDFSCPPSAMRLRKMRSVDALELALAKMQADAARHFTTATAITESPSLESLNADDFANATTTHVGELIAHPQSQNDTPGQSRCPTPTLFLTSPTGARPPQPLVLEGSEFEPKSISPSTKKLLRPVARRSTTWKASKRGEQSRSASENNQQSSCSSSEETQDRRGRRMQSRRSRADPVADDSQASSSSSSASSSGSERLEAPRIRRNRASKSSPNLRQAKPAAVPYLPPSLIGKLTGSEQVHALHRNLQKRKSSLEQSSAAVSTSASNSIPQSPATPTNDDPFNDFVALRGHKKEDKDAAKTSSSIFEQASTQDRRLPLGESAMANNEAAKSLRRTKRSGVGLACLVDLEANNVVGMRKKVVDPIDRPRSRSSQSAGGHAGTTSDHASSRKSFQMHTVNLSNDENVNPILDSPTALASRRSQNFSRNHPRASLGQRG